jgi:malate dehydrogenase
MVGSAAASRLLEDGVARTLVLVDAVEGLARAVALDLAQSAPLRGHGIDVTGGADYGPTEGSELVVVTAGVPRRPGQSRADLLATNAAVVAEVAAEVRERSPDAVVVVVTNPVDEMTALAWEVTGFPASRVMGMAGVLDTARFRAFIAAEVGADPSEVEALVLGSHGETMVPLPRLARVRGRPLAELVGPERVEALVARTRDAGAEIVALLPRGSAWFAPAAAVADMARAIARDEGRVVSACAHLEGQYGIEGVFVGVPVRLGRAGILEVVELPLEPAELAALRAAAETVRARVADLGTLPAGTARERPVAAPVGEGRPAVAGVAVDLRLRSRVRQAAARVLWEQVGRAEPAQVEALCDAVLGRLGAGGTGASDNRTDGRWAVTRG